MEWRIRRVVPEDARTVRTLRLAMFDTYPDAFFTDVDAWRSYGIAFWLDFTHRAATSKTEAIFIAGIDDDMLAMAHVVIRGEQAEFGMQFVAPEAQRRGIGAALIAERERWAQANGAVVAHCAIVVGNLASERLHETAGWIATDEVVLERAPTADAPAVYERRWHKPLTR